jgi:hypothetical protein
MITGEFIDESIVRYRVEQKRMMKEQFEQVEKIDITKGYAYINGKRVTFSQIPLLGKKLSALIPDVFIEERTPIVTEYTAELCNYDGSVSLFFEIPQNLESIQSSTTLNWTESWESIEAEGENRYHLDFEDTQIRGKFSCAEYRLEDWKEILHQIMYSAIAMETQEGEDGA